MEKEETAVQTKFHAFLKQRNSKTNAAMQEAQRLVNLYRVLDVFGTDFVDEYNTQLQNCSDEVQMSLRALVGGQEVCKYLEFLNAEKQKDETAENKQNIQVKGWLPSPEEELENQKGNASGGYVSSTEWNEFIKAEDEKLTEMIKTLKEEQNETLKRLMAQVESSLQLKEMRSENKEKNTGKPENSYSEIIEEKR